MLSVFLTWTRRRWRGEIAVDELPERSDGPDAYANADLRASVQAALRALPSRQRAVVVLRFCDDLTEPQAAAVLGCSVGTVKSQNAKALTRLRASRLLQGTWDEEASRDGG